MRGESRDVEEFKEFLKVVREEVPTLLRELVEPLKELMGLTLDEEQAKNRAKAIAAFYKELIDSGIDREAALSLTKEQFVNPLSILQEAIKSASWRRSPRE